MTAPLAPPVALPGSGVPHLYVHVPFCARKCPYCDFNSHAGRDAEIDRYLAALAAEARAVAAGLRPRTAFVGGGTPTHPSASQVERYLADVLGAAGTERLEEVTVEANPGTLDLAKVRAMRRGGVTRASVGVQSFDDRHLRALGRIHDAGDAVRAVSVLRDGGLERLSLDLILAIPGQTLADQARDVDRALDLAPEHVSAYVLTIEEGTAFETMVASGRMAAPDDDRDLAHLHLVAERLEGAGWRRYEISNYARPGAECRHNVGYWEGADWIGIGAGAHSHVAGTRWKNVDDPARYAEAVLAGRSPVERVEREAPGVLLFDALMMGLRLVDGVDLDLVEARTGLDARRVHADAIADLAAEGLVVLDGSRLRLTARGLDLASWVTRAFLPSVETA